MTDDTDYVNNYWDNHTIADNPAEVGNLEVLCVFGFAICCSYTIRACFRKMIEYCEARDQFRIDSLLSQEYSPSEQCSICLDNFQGDVVTLQCHHSFHKDCVSEWITSKNHRFRLI